MLKFKDIHTHNLNAGDDAVINLPLGMYLPDSGHYSVGIHPWDTDSVNDADIEWVRTLAADPRVVAIGETGLDALLGAPLDEQQRIFLEHIRISEDTGKPLIIHAVRTLPVIMQLRKQLRPKQQWIIHGYRGNAVTARQLIRLGIDISLGKKFNPEVPEEIPPEHIYRETD